MHGSVIPSLRQLGDASMLQWANDAFAGFEHRVAMAFFLQNVCHPIEHSGVEIQLTCIPASCLELSIKGFVSPVRRKPVRTQLTCPLEHVQSKMNFRSLSTRPVASEHDVPLQPVQLLLETAA